MNLLATLKEKSLSEIKVNHGESRVAGKIAAIFIKTSKFIISIHYFINFLKDTYFTGQYVSKGVYTLKIKETLLNRDTRGHELHPSATATGVQKISRLVSKVKSRKKRRKVEH